MLESKGSEIEITACVSTVTCSHLRGLNQAVSGGIKLSGLQRGKVEPGLFWQTHFHPVTGRLLKHSRSSLTGTHTVLPMQRSVGETDV